MFRRCIFMEQIAEVLLQLVVLDEIRNLEVGRSTFAVGTKVECTPASVLANDSQDSSEYVKSICFVHGIEWCCSSRFPGAGELGASVRRQLSGPQKRAKANKCYADKGWQEILCNDTAMILRPS